MHEREVKVVFVTRTEVSVLICLQISTTVLSWSKRDGRCCGMGGAVDWNAFPDKFHQSAKKILVKMNQNAHLIADNMKRTVEELLGRNR